MTATCSYTRPTRSAISGWRLGGHAPEREFPRVVSKRGGFVFHDLRHMLNTNMGNAGIAEVEIMAITGHSTREMSGFLCLHRELICLGNTNLILAVDNTNRYSSVRLFAMPL